MEQQTPTLAAVPNLADKRKAKKKAEAKLQKIAPVARKVSDKMFEVSACDGHQLYMWVAEKRGKSAKFKVTEIFPGLAKKKTRVRTAEEALDLVLEGKFDDEDDVLEEIDEILFEDDEAFGADEPTMQI